MGFIIAAILGALGRRIAGGVFQQWSGLDAGDYPVRAFFGLMLMLSAAIGGYSSWPVLLLVPSTFIGCSLPVGGIGMGRGNPTRYWHDFWTVTAHGAGNMGLAALPYLWLGGHWWWLLLAGFAIAPLYELGWRIDESVRRSILPLGLMWGSEWGEALWGAACGVAAWGLA